MTLYIDTKMIRSLNVQVGLRSLLSSFGSHEAIGVLCVLGKGCTRARLVLCQFRPIHYIQDIS